MWCWKVKIEFIVIYHILVSSEQSMKTFRAGYRRSLTIGLSAGLLSLNVKFLSNHSAPFSLLILHNIKLKKEFLKFAENCRGSEGEYAADVEPVDSSVANERPAARLPPCHRISASNGRLHRGRTSYQISSGLFETKSVLKLMKEMQSISVLHRNNQIMFSQSGLTLKSLKCHASDNSPFQW